MVLLRKLSRLSSMGRNNGWCVCNLSLIFEVFTGLVEVIWLCIGMKVNQES